MENETSDQQRQLMISAFLEINVSQTVETAIQFLKATNWELDEAINLFHTQRINQPLPYEDTLYDSSMYHTSSVAVCPNDIWDSGSRLSSLYRPPLNLLFNGSFEDAKTTSSREDLWLLVNLQSTTEFASHTLNRDLWSNDVVSHAIESRFILWQVYDHTNEGKKISTLYEIDTAPPVVLLIDPITGQKMRTWSGMIEAHYFLEDLMIYIDAGPCQQIILDFTTKL